MYLVINLIKFTKISSLNLSCGGFFVEEFYEALVNNETITNLTLINIKEIDQVSNKISSLMKKNESIKTLECSTLNDFSFLKENKTLTKIVYFDKKGSINSFGDSMKNNDTIKYLEFKNSDLNHIELKDIFISNKSIIDYTLSCRF